MADHSIDDLDNGDLEGSSGPNWERDSARERSESFESRHADKILGQAPEADEQGESDGPDQPDDPSGDQGGDLEQRVSELEDLAENLSKIVLALEDHIDQQ